MSMVNRTSVVSSARALDIEGVLGILTLTMLSIWGVWELFRGGANRFHLLSIFVALFLSGLTVLIVQFFASRAALSEARLAHERLRLSMVAGHSASWDLNVKTGQELWFGDLNTLFGIPSDTLSEPREDFYRYLHPADRQQVSRALTEAREKCLPYTVEFRSVHGDRTVRWISAAGEFQYSKRGDPERMLGIAVDITERKLAEEAMASIGRRLIEAHEEERTHIGRELHDDINQRLALLGVELDRGNQRLPSSPQLREYVRHAQQRITDIARDVQSLSHRLHSSKLDYLGLATAANSFCRELSEKSDVGVDFSHAGIPSTLPKEVSLCLFRVLQEALQNAVKHSGVKYFTVDLHGTSEAVELTVTDTGFGFEEQEAFTRQGLGLISMRERLQLVHGEFSVESHRGAGTTIRTRVPLNRDQLQAMAG
jgi:signal transduction histidine kinase